VVIGTPGRVLDFAETPQALELRWVAVAVLDEADRMLDLGFAEAVTAILNYTRPAHRQTLLFSATWPEQIHGVADAVLRNPVIVRIGSPPTQPVGPLASPNNMPTLTGSGRRRDGGALCFGTGDADSGGPITSRGA